MPSFFYLHKKYNCDKVQNTGKINKEMPNKMEILFLIGVENHTNRI